MPVIPKEGTGLDPSQLKNAESSQQSTYMQSLNKRGRLIDHAEQDQGAKAATEDFQSKGPQIPDGDSLPPKASRAELEARKKELNQ